MADEKPRILAHLKPGKLIDTFSGFVQTFNWIVSCWANITTGKDSFLTIGNVSKGTPTFDIDEDALKNKIKQYVLNDPEIVNTVISRINIVGGSDTNLVATRDGNTFVINVYYK